MVEGREFTFVLVFSRWLTSPTVVLPTVVLAGLDEVFSTVCLVVSLVSLGSGSFGNLSSSMAIFLAVSLVATV